MRGRCVERLLQRGIVAFQGQDCGDPSPLVWSARIGSGMEQPTDHLHLPGQAVRAGFTRGFPEPSDCLMKGGEPELVPCGRLRAGREQHLDAWRMTLEAGFVQRRVSLAVPGIYLRALFQEQGDQRQVASGCRGDEGRGPSGIAGFDIGTTVEQ